MLVQPLTKESLIKGLQNIGVQRNDLLVVHSSLHGLGPVEGGADTVLDALLTCIAPDGLLVMPTFTYRNEVFNPATSPSRTGILTELLRKRSTSVRSLHPTHSVVALGKGADGICERHHTLPGLGINTPLDRIAKAGGHILLLGVGQQSNSTIHVGEVYAGVPYLNIPFEPTSPPRAFVEGGLGMVELRDPPGCSRAFGAIEAHLRQRGAIRDGKIGNALAQWMSGQEVITVTTNLLRQDHAALLCTDPDCYRCNRARDSLAH